MYEEREHGAYPFPFHSIPFHSPVPRNTNHKQEITLETIETAPELETD